ncbi:hypothetical protein [Candidatus Chlorohelix sp.]|uniref:hypothetical protein n=1 Tax=Candidatus Chlorohelix sp. TaxID=3139201 RepID=UPI0030598BDC
MRPFCLAQISWGGGQSGEGRIQRRPYGLILLVVWGTVENINTDFAKALKWLPLLLKVLESCGKI